MLSKGKTGSPQNTAGYALLTFAKRISTVHCFEYEFGIGRFLPFSRIFQRSHRFPQNAEFRKNWTIATRRKDFTPTIHSRLCSKYFTEDCYQIRPGASYRYLKDDAIPTIFDMPSHMQTPVKKMKNVIKKSQNEEAKECSSSRKRKTTKAPTRAKKILLEENRNDADGGTYNKATPTNETVYIKQETLEPEIDMREESAPDSQLSIEAFDSQPDAAVETKVPEKPVVNIKTEFPEIMGTENEVPEEMYSENIKTEVLELTDVHEEGSVEWGCEDCHEEYVEGWDLAQHLLENHLDTKSTTTLNDKPKCSPNLEDDLSRLTSKSEYLPGCSEQSIPSKYDHTPGCSEQSIPCKCNPANPQPTRILSAQNILPPFTQPSVSPSPLSQTLDSLKKPLPPCTLDTLKRPLPPCATDTSDIFAISLSHFPNTMRVAIKRKMLEVVTAVETFRVNPELIIVAHMAQSKPKL